MLDEPTAALDARAEHRVFSGLRGLARDRAVLPITHRLANVAVADRIVVLNRGRIEQEGDFDRLSTEPGLFRDLWQLQQRAPRRRGAADSAPALPTQNGRAAAAGDAVS